MLKNLDNVLWIQSKSQALAKENELTQNVHE